MGATLGAGRIRPTELKRQPLAQKHNWLANGLLAYALRPALGHLRGVLLDVGCGAKPYAVLLGPQISRHWGMEHPATGAEGVAADLFGDAHRLPFGDETLDSVLCTEVLEHLERPAGCLRELHRVLRPGGMVVVSAPFLWHLHELPRDFHRFTQYGLRSLLTDSGFTVLSVRTIGGVGSCLAETLVYYLAHRRRRFHRVRGFLMECLQRAGLWFDQTRFTDQSWHLGCVALAQKPADDD
jgi:SAM-dependent methyltransferase